MNNIKKVDYLIIGNSAGGIGAAEAIREIDGNGSLVIVSDESYKAYSRPMISEYLAGRCSIEELLYRGTDFYENKGIQLILGKRVGQINAGSHTVRLEGGEIISWDKLLLATGGRPVMPDLKGINHNGVFTFITLDDARAIEKYLDHKVRQVVVIGGGLIGISVTEALVRRGLKVTIIEMKERLLNTILDEAASALVESRLAEAGVRVVTGHTVGDISGSPGTGVAGVSTNDGMNIPCEMLVIAIGVRPRADLAVEAGLKINRGIVVDRYMATSAADVYACGDAAEAYDFVYGENRLTPVWPNASLGGRVAGFNMAGVVTEYPGGTSMNSLKYFGLAVVSAGMVSPADDDCEILSTRHDHNYRKVVLKNGTIAGMVLVGGIEKAGIIFNLMKEMVHVDGFKQSLVAEDFGLVSLPDEIWRPRLELPPSLVPRPVVVAAQPEEMAAGD